MKDRSYHEGAILYNEELADKAEELIERIEHPVPKKWVTSVAKQHRFHEKRHRAALERLDQREQAEETSAPTTEQESE